MKTEYGKVYLTGAGPGDPGLITVKATDKLKQADVVVYDRLINNDLLSYCKKGCEKIFVGKESGHHPIEQEKITEILICKAMLGFDVVRLKGGNPFVFGRGSEEAKALKAAGIEYEIIPGITSGLSAPIYSGIPITQRGMITQCVLITAHECPEKPETQVDWEKLAKLKNTSLIIYMGGSRIERIARELIRNGMNPATPAAAIENGTLPKQRTITARLDGIADEYKKQNLHPPVIIMVSPTISLRDDISWYEQKPLFNKRIFISGKINNKKKLYGMITDSGGEILSIPFFENRNRIPNESLSESIGVPMTYFHSLTPELANFSNHTEDYSQLDEKEFNTNNKILNAIKGYDNDSQPSEVSNSNELERESKIYSDMVLNGIDAFVFGTAISIDKFFDTFGYETADKLLSHGNVLTLDKSSAERLFRNNIFSVKITENATVESIYSSLCNLVRTNDA